MLTLESWHMRAQPCPQPNHGISALTQWLSNFTNTKPTPIMLAIITYGTYVLLRSCCVLMVVYTILYVPGN